MNKNDMREIADGLARLAAVIERGELDASPHS